jgi:hypothetical protein
MLAFMNDDLIGLYRLSWLLKLPREWLRKEAEEDRIPCLRVKRRLLFNFKAVEAALAERAAVGRATSLPKGSKGDQ